MPADERIPVLFLLPFYRWGGPGSLLRILLRHMSRYRGIVAVPPDAEGQDLLRDTGAKVIELPGLRTVPRRLASPALPLELAHEARLLGRILGTLRAERPTLVHSFTEGLLLGGAAARILGIPSVIHTIGMTIFHPWEVGLVTSRLLSRLADRLLCAQPLIRNEYLGFGVPPARLRLLANCIEPEVVRAQAGPVARAEGAPLLTFVASMDRRKGHDLLLEAVAILKDRGRAVRLRVIGATTDDPGFYRELQDLVERRGIADRVEFTGGVYDVPRRLADAWIHVVPSRIEALPLAGIEAMTLGLPVVATRVGGNPYLVEEGVTGLLAEAAQPASLADRIAELLDDPERARRMGRAGRQRVAELFDAAVVAPKLEGIYDELLGQPETWTHRHQEQ